MPEIKEHLQHILSVAKTIDEDARLKWSHCCDEKNNHWESPYIDVLNGYKAREIADELMNEGVDASEDLYEDDDGEGDGGRPIIRHIWSVRLPGIKLKEVNISEKKLEKN